MVNEKVAFIHYAKAAGRFINNYLMNNVFQNADSRMENQNYKVFNSWNRNISNNNGNPARDWSEDELFSLAIDRSEYQLPTEEQLEIHNAQWEHGYLDRQYVHNHHISWSEQSIQEFNRNGWLTFMFLRDPVELLCSLYFWAKDQLNLGVKPSVILQPVYLLDLSLDAFLNEIVACDARVRKLYCLPDYVGSVTYVAEFSMENFSFFLKQYFAHDLQIQKIDLKYQFPSSNKGSDYYLSTGQIKQQTLHRLSTDSEIVKFRTFLSSGTKTSVLLNV